VAFRETKRDTFLAECMQMPILSLYTRHIILRFQRKQKLTNNFPRENRETDTRFILAHDQASNGTLEHRQAQGREETNTKSSLLLQRIEPTKRWKTKAKLQRHSSILILFEQNHRQTELEKKVRRMKQVKEEHGWNGMDGTLP